MEAAVSTERLTILESGNVGIGTDAPSAPLHIDAQTSSEVIKIEADNDPYISFLENGVDKGYIQFTTNDAYIQKEGSGPLYFRMGSTNRVTIENGGNVGIGTTSPTEKLDVRGDTFLSGNASIDGNIELPALSRVEFGPYNIMSGEADANSVTLQKVGSNYKFQFSTQVGSFSVKTATQHRIELDGDGESAGGYYGAALTYGEHAAASNNNGRVLECTNGSAEQGNRGRTYVNGNFYVQDYSTESAVLKAEIRNDGSAYFYGAHTSGVSGLFSDKVGIGTTAPLALLDVRGDLSGSGSFLGTGVGNRITNNGTPYLLSGDAASALTLQDVCDNDNSTTTSILSTGPHISGVTGLFSERVGIGTSVPSYDLDFAGGSTIRINSGAANSTSMRVGGGNLDVTLLRVDNAAGITDVGSYGFSLKYMGTRLGNDNALSVFSDNSSAMGQIEAVTILQDGKVGIGTDAPSDLLDVVHYTSPAIRIEDLTNNVITRVLSDDNKGRIGTFSNNDFSLYSNSSERMVITSAGNVGIGTTAPAYPLHVVGSSRPALFESDDGVNIIKFGNSACGVATYNGLDLVVNSTANSQVNAYGMPLTFGTSTGNGVNVTERMRIEEDGKVGIGTSAPLALLDVRGDLSGSGSFLGTGVGNRITNNGTPYLLSGDAAAALTLQDVCDNDNSTTTSILSTGPHISGVTGLFSDNLGIGTNNPLSKLYVSDPTNSSINAASTGHFTIGGPGYALGISMDAVGASIYHNSPSRTLSFGTDYTARMTIAAAGNVGIGTITPTSPLEVKTTFGGDLLRLNTTSVGHLLFSSSTDDGRSVAKIATTSSSLDLKFHSSSARSYFQGGQVVGIGTYDPQSQLQVIGTGLFSENVGIGTTTPLKELHVVGDIWGFSSAPAGTGDAYSVAGGSALDGNYRMAGLRFDRLNDVAKFGCYKNTILHEEGYIAITSGGLVGIGTTDPSAELHVHEADAGTFTFDGNADNLIVESLGNGGITIATAAASDSRIIFATPNDATSAEIKYSDSNSLMTIGPTTPSDSLVLQAGNGAEAMRIDSAGNVGIGSYPTNKLDVFGHFTATTKSFLIDHPTKENKKLQYASLEGPEHAVYVRGTHNGSLIELPEYWSELVHEDSLTVVLTPLGKHQNLYVKSKDTNHISVGGVKGSYDYVVYGERKDTDKLEVEPLKV